MSTIEQQRSQLVDRLTPLVVEAGFDVDDIVVTRVGRRILVRVTIDAEGGIGVDDIARVSRVLDEALDAADPFADPFVLEVSSPGVDRPLTTATHWKRNVDRLVRVDVAGKPVTGRIVSADATTVVLDVDRSRQELALSALGPGKVQIEFNRPGEASGADEPATAQSRPAHLPAEAMHDTADRKHDTAYTKKG